MADQYVIKDTEGTGKLFKDSAKGEFLDFLVVVVVGGPCACVRRSVHPVNIYFSLH